MTLPKYLSRLGLCFTALLLIANICAMSYWTIMSDPQILVMTSVNSDIIQIVADVVVTIGNYFTKVGNPVRRQRWRVVLPTEGK